jgi:hypothetical protein
MTVRWLIYQQLQLQRQSKVQGSKFKVKGKTRNLQDDNRTYPTGDAKKKNKQRNS